MDIVSQAARSRMMSGIRGKDTKPELIVRSVAHCLGLRFRLHDRKLPGSPDLVMRKHRAVVFVHGCFWHRHACPMAATPKTRTDFWATKFEANQHRDARNRQELMALGWRVLEIWECETKQPEVVTARLEEFFALARSNALRPTAQALPPEAVELSAQLQRRRPRSRKS
jgi:DNA mismatch endonuclease (patch repair protein)